MSILSKIFGDANERYIGSLEPIVLQINELEKEYEKLSDMELKSKTEEFKTWLVEGKSLDDIIPEAFAAVREASKRTLGQRHFDVQLMGGMVLHRGKIAEMRTGEGKTLVATLPAYLNALTGKGVHIVTVNDFLARRDAAWMGQIYNALGLTVGCINHDGSYLYDQSHQKKDDPLDKKEDLKGSFLVVHEFLRPVNKRDAYYADITYGTNNEYGFDYLRDNMFYSAEQMSQRQEFNFAIVDEVDSILIDEARTPLIISAPDSDSTNLYQTFSKTIPRLVENEDYNIDEKLKAVTITEKGIEKVEKMLNLSNIYDQGGVRYVHHLEQALKAQVLFKRDRDYVVREGEVIIVDEFTGRLMPGRRWSEGLHQAVEAKEGVNVQKESRTLATITFQNYFRLYKKIAGMTGTAKTSAEEFHEVYNIDVVSVPTNKPAVRRDLADRIYKSEMGKLKAVASEVKERNDKGQPVLIGTVSIEKNELLSKLLEREGVKHNVLNAKNHEKEAELHAQAGRLGTVTVATNMAGRGVDIMLGGFAPSKFKINEGDSSLTEEYKAWEKEREKILELGGLHVIGTERHEARRIDDQLRGRAGRQGDSGSSQFFVSTEDDVIRVFGGDRLKSLMETLGVGEEDVIENGFISRAIEQAQSRIEGHNFDIRKYVLEYDDVMNKHRGAIYNLRREVLFSGNIKETVLGYVLDVVNQIVSLHAPEDEISDWNLEEISESIKALVVTSTPSVNSGQVPLSTSQDNLASQGDLHSNIIEVSADRNFHKLSEFIVDFILKTYEAKEKEVGLEMMRQLEKFVLLRTIDELWMDHIESMEQLRDSVRLRAYGQRDPLIEYKLEGQKMFEQLQDSVKGQVANLIFKVSLMGEPKKVELQERRPDVRNIQDDGSVGSEGSHQSEQAKRSNISNGRTDVGRNDLCPCGSGKKYKRCHGK